MVANENPGVCGVAARLPKNPGTQKLTPPSSARAMFGADARAASASAASERVQKTPQRLRIRAPTDLQ